MREVRARDDCMRKKMYTKFSELPERPQRAAIAILVFLLISVARCFSADVVLLRSGNKLSTEQRELELATQFYGLNLKLVPIGDKQTAALIGTINPELTVAVAIEANALAYVDKKTLLHTLSLGRAGRIPLLILGVTPETSTRILKAWSGISAIIVKPIHRSIGQYYSVGAESGVTQQLTGLEFPYLGDEAFYFLLGQGSRFHNILSVRDDRQVAPVFIEEDLQDQKIFLLSGASPSADIVSHSNSDLAEDAFVKIAAVMMFTKYCAGEKGWHALGHYANVTIDDPWLREPYGNLSYEGLLKEMEKHNFHTSIAFIPWNYDRNNADVVSLFQSHPDRFSICIHGNNHDHKEFTDYASKPLDVQIVALKQSMARMESFTEQTGIPYEKVMVFPHSIAPEQTLEALKANGYLATINSQNIPMGSTRPRDPLFAMRPITLSFGGLPSIIRYTVAGPTPGYRVAINDFLDNPLFFYAHQDVFAKGIDALDDLADQVNRIEPDTKWRGVGEIVKHLYVLKKRDGDSYDVLAFSSSIVLDNPSSRDAVFYIKKQESGVPIITSVTVNQEHLSAQLRDGYVEMQVGIPAGGSRRISIQYGDSPDLRNVNTSKHSLYVFLLREVSDFRDIVLSRVYVGRAVINFYYKHGLTPKFTILCGSGLIIFCTFVGWSLIAVIRKKNVAGAALVHPTHQ
jgi:hypothetical protein